MIAFEHVSRVFGDVIVLKDITFEVKTGEFVTIFGPNGSGKSTLMNILCGLDQPTGGYISGADIVKNHVGFVFQDYRRALFPWLSGRENILFPLNLRGASASVQEQKLQYIIDKLKPNINLAQPVFTLSGGQAQMISLMRALIIEPKLLILDEPFSALDYGRTLELRQTMLQISTLFDLTTLFISHDLDEALYLGDRVVFFSAKPTIIRDILEVPFGRERVPALLADPQFAALKAKALERVF